MIMLERINIILTHIHQGLLSWIPSHSADLAEVIDDWFLQNRLPEIALVAGTCKASGGNPEDPKSIRVMTALLAELISLEILNDYAKKTNPDSLWLKIGAERAMHYSHMLQVLFGRLFTHLLEEDRSIGKPVLNRFQESILIALAARSRTAGKEIQTWESYWKYTEMTSAYFTGALAAAGAELATAGNAPIIEIYRNFGYHLGMARHIITELQHFSGTSLQYPGCRNLNLGVLYGLHCEHPDQMELKQIVWRDQLQLQSKRVKEILDKINTQDYLVWAALKEKKLAMELIANCAEQEGKEFLTAFTLEWFNRVPAFDKIENISLAEARQINIPQTNLDLNSEFTGTPALGYKSIGLGIRKNIRGKPLRINY